MHLNIIILVRSRIKASKCIAERKPSWKFECCFDKSVQREEESITNSQSTTNTSTFNFVTFWSKINQKSFIESVKRQSIVNLQKTVPRFEKVSSILVKPSKHLIKLKIIHLPNPIVKKTLTSIKINQNTTHTWMKLYKSHYSPIRIFSPLNAMFCFYWWSLTS